jgi:type IV secretory pathway VirJ component
MRSRVVLGAAVCLVLASSAWSQTRQTVTIRGHVLPVFVYGSPKGEPVLVSSGDGGWMHLGPDVAEFLSGRGYYVIGFDVKAYLSAFTTDKTTLRAENVPGDYGLLAALASKATGRRPILIGVSEGAGLSVLAAAAPETKSAVAGVIGLGLPDENELGWRWTDTLTYLTRQTPDEPVFSTAAIVDRVAPLPLAAIHSTHDEFVPLAEIQRVVARAREPKHLWLVSASNHRFSGGQEEFERRLIEALGWVKERSPR